MPAASPWATEAVHHRTIGGAALAAALLLTACSSESSAGGAPEVCAAIEEVARLDIETDTLLDGDWDVAIVGIKANIGEQNTQFDVIIAADVGDASEAAEDIKSFNEAMEAAGALEAASAREFSDLMVDGVNGSAEAGAGRSVLQDYATANCT